MRALVVSNLLCAQQSSFHGSLCKSTLRWIFLKFWMNVYMWIHSFTSCPNSKSTSYHWKWFHQYGPVTLCICMLLGMDGFVALQSSLPNPCSVCMVSRFNGRTPSFWQPRSRTSSWNRRQLIGAELFCSCPKCILSNYYHITLRYFLASFWLFRVPTFLIPTILISFVTVNTIQMRVWIFGSCCLTQIPSKNS